MPSKYRTAGSRVIWSSQRYGPPPSLLLLLQGERRPAAIRKKTTYRLFGEGTETEIAKKTNKTLRPRNRGKNEKKSINKETETAPSDMVVVRWQLEEQDPYDIQSFICVLAIAFWCGLWLMCIGTRICNALIRWTLYKLGWPTAVRRHADRKARDQMQQELGHLLCQPEVQELLCMQE